MHHTLVAVVSWAPIGKATFCKHRNQPVTGEAEGGREKRYWHQTLPACTRVWRTSPRPKKKQLLFDTSVVITNLVACLTPLVSCEIMLLPWK
jgi:hypothetical protein